MGFRTRTPSPLQQTRRERTAKFELEVAARLAWRVAELERERILAEQEAEKGEHWRLGGGRRIPPGAVPQRMELSTSPSAKAMPAARTCAQSLQTPVRLINCNSHPFQFP